MRIRYWSSDVCSSDLEQAVDIDMPGQFGCHLVERRIDVGMIVAPARRDADTVQKRAAQIGGREEPVQIGPHPRAGRADGAIGSSILKRREGQREPPAAAFDRKSTHLNYSH